MTHEVRLLEKNLAEEESSCSDLLWTLEAPCQVTQESFPLQAVSCVSQEDPQVLKAFQVKLILQLLKQLNLSVLLLENGFSHIPGRNGAGLSSELPSAEEITMGGVCVLGERNIKPQHCLLNICKYMDRDLA